ncbi:bifunctional nuclease family protein [Fimbriimonas ginsengisoli]|uniref:UvrB/UvrC protein n=1 Tax=Fimbriimonas ginsengisoli Gsoil 348 TaxID=661478 RepID=A0A068NXA2_FIMGI|nr:bifunctional nuclease family protein [Fimbriimonas ginsengisoli]AIE87977.1 UvrB/UvrC protein [Fimbriimonas ginsengisoli Gsoil 348]
MAEEFEGPDGSDNLDEPPAFFPYDATGGEREPAGNVELVEVQIEGIFEQQNMGNVARFVLVTDGTRRLPILIGPFEAQAIAMVIDNERPDRPMTHDLMRNIMDRLNATLDRVVIDDFWNTVYYAKLYLKTQDEEIELDSRPSDAIALAVRFDAPIFVADTILDAAMED